MFLRGSCAFVLGSFAVVSAVKDDEYYRAGMGNPNVDLKMYWAEPHNVLEDLDQFSSLYIQYHNCAWAQNRAQYAEEESGSGDETDYWYMDATPTYAANVAYSLYGSLSGESFSGCNANTFINSFTTNQGFESFAAAIYYAGSSATDYSQSYSSECQGGAGVVCDYQYGFSYASFSTDTCDPYYATGTTDSMGYMNSAFQAAQCVQIYDGSYYNNRDLKEEENKGGHEDSKNGDNGKNKIENSDEDRNLQNSYGYGYGYNSYASNYYNYAGTALSILYYSNACFIQNYWAIDGGCPDPYGILQEYQQNFNKGVRMSAQVDTYVTYRANMDVGKKYVKIGGLLFMAALVMFLSEQLMAFRAKKRVRGVKSGPSTKKMKSVVGLVRTTSTRIKKSASKGVKNAVARVTNKAKAKGATNAPEKDGIMVHSPDDTNKAKAKGATNSPEKDGIMVDSPDETVES